MLALIKKKRKSGNKDMSEGVEKPKPQQGAQVIDLMDLLKQSIGGKSRGKSGKAANKRAKQPARKTAARSRHAVRKSA